MPNKTFALDRLAYPDWFLSGRLPNSDLPLLLARVLKRFADQWRRRAANGSTYFYKVRSYVIKDGKIVEGTDSPAVVAGGHEQQ